MIKHSQHIVVGMSGGVDSSVAAYLLQQQGYDVQGVFMKNWEGDDEDEYCAAEEDLKDARAVCKTLGIDIHGINFSDQYWDRVFEYFLTEYKAGRTPNPDILCNKEIKFKAFLDYALSIGADKIATGHYVRVRETPDGFQLLRGKDENKDQSYFLYTLNQQQLSKSLFPIGELEKPQVRAIAEQQHLVTAHKKDSTGICFIGERHFRDFLKRYIPAQPGEIRTPEGKLLGKHEGLMYYTLGQRQGLGIGGVKGYEGATWYVADKDLDNNILIVVDGSDHPLLYKRELIATDLHWIAPMAPSDDYQCSAKTRYRSRDANCTLHRLDNGNWQVVFDEPQWAVTPGQAVVIYDQEVCLGGGTII